MSMRTKPWRRFLHRAVQAVSEIAAISLLPWLVVGADLPRYETSDPAFNPSPPPPGAPRASCPGTLVWTTGMVDDYIPPLGCPTAYSAQCMVLGENPDGFPQDWRFGADDFLGAGGPPITHVKVWGLYNTTGYDSGRRVRGFTIRIFRASESIYCPDGSRPGWESIGSAVYDRYTMDFVETELPTALPRNFNYCITLPAPFYAQPGQAYWLSIAADYDLVVISDAYTQWFWRVVDDGIPHAPYCEAAWHECSPDSCANWINISTGLGQPCWAGWDAAFELYSNAVPPVLGACCFAAAPCQQRTAVDCADLGGVYRGDYTSCDTTDCAVQTFITKPGLLGNQIRIAIPNDGPSLITIQRVVPLDLPSFFRNFQLLGYPNGIPPGYAGYVLMKYDVMSNPDGPWRSSMSVRIDFEVDGVSYSLTKSHPVEMQLTGVAGGCVSAVEYEDGHPRFLDNLISGIPGRDDSRGPQSALPGRLTLRPPYPNPMREAADILFALPKPGSVRLEIFDVAGRRVRSLADGVYSAGYFHARWDGRNENGRRTSAGVYYYTLTLNGESLRQSVVVLN